MKYDATIMLITVLLTNCFADKKNAKQKAKVCWWMVIFALFFSTFISGEIRLHHLIGVPNSQNYIVFPSGN